MCCASVSLNYMCHTFNKAVIDKISNFPDIAPNFTFSYFFKYILQLFRPNASSPIDFMAGTCQEYSFSFLPVVSR